MHSSLIWLSLVLCGPDVVRLGADSFEVREAAESRLKSHAWIARPLLLLSFSDVERSRRVKRVLKRWENSFSPPGGVWPAIGFLSAQAEPVWAHSGVEGEQYYLYWFAGYQFDTSSITYRYLARFNAKSPPLCIAIAHRQATKWLITDMRRAGVPDWACYALLSLLLDKEKSLRPLTSNW